MVIKHKQANQVNFGPMSIWEYKINQNFSGALVHINGDHGAVKCIDEDRLYFIIKGEGVFVIDSKESMVEQNDVIFVPKNTPYNIIGNMEFFLICSPEYDPEKEVKL